MTPEERISNWIKEAVDCRGTSIRFLERATEINRNKLGALGKGGPELTVGELLRLCEALQKDPVEALGARKQVDLGGLANIVDSFRNFPSIQDIGEWLRGNNCKLDAANPLHRHLVLVKIPTLENDTIEVEWVGDRSLTCEVLLTQDPSAAIDYTMTLPDQKRRDLVLDYEEASRHGDVIIKSRTTEHPLDKSKEINYWTMLAKCELPDGSTRIANASSLLRPAHGVSAFPATH